MSKIFFSLNIGLALIIIHTFSGCDPHAPSDHPCNFPDAETENNLRVPWTYKIIDESTSINLVDTTESAAIHLDSVALYDENFTAIPNSYDFHIDNWIFLNFAIYKNVPYNDPQALLELDQKTFYLKTSHNDYDTIDVFFDQCLINSVLFNDKITLKPNNHSYDGGASFYFKK